MDRAIILGSFSSVHRCGCFSVRRTDAEIFNNARRYKGQHSGSVVRKDYFYYNSNRYNGRQVEGGIPERNSDTKDPAADNFRTHLKSALPTFFLNWIDLDLPEEARRKVVDLIFHKKLTDDEAMKDLVFLQVLWRVWIWHVRRDTLKLMRG